MCYGRTFKGVLRNASTSASVLILVNETTLTLNNKNHKGVLVRDCKNEKEKKMQQYGVGRRSSSLQSALRPPLLSTHLKRVATGWLLIGSRASRLSSQPHLRIMLSSSAPAVDTVMTCKKETETLSSISICLLRSILNITGASPCIPSSVARFFISTFRSPLSTLPSHFVNLAGNLDVYRRSPPCRHPLVHFNLT